MKIQLAHKFEDIISIENLLSAWREFIRGKRNKRDVQEFSLQLMDNILELHYELTNHTYRHSSYQAFNISDPKPRNIHKANVRDRLLHHAIHRILYPFFNKTFISDSYSCRLNKGSHRAMNRFRCFSYKISRNHTQTGWVLKCDIKKFFASIDHDILVRILEKYISDQDIRWLLERVIRSFQTSSGRGLPLGNLTSQLFCNIYMNEFDQFMKHKTKARYYIRYADDFVIFSENYDQLIGLRPLLKDFLERQFNLLLHPQKIFIKALAAGVDFLGWVHFLDHRVLRTATKRRMLKRIAETQSAETIISYLGLLQHGNTFKIKKQLYFNIDI
ncbi:MAG: reverse transcriptase domain-containing protein [bacterium]|nr:reverse transcriptase domain-containing protein [bacterium]